MPNDHGIDLDAMLDDLDADTQTELASKPEVEMWNGDLDVSQLPIKTRKWVTVPDLVAVVSDLQDSTHLSTGKHAASTASIYQAAVGSLVKIYHDFDANFIAIQGDGAFALFWGDDRFTRAVSAGVTVKTFSERHLVPRIESKWPEYSKSHPTGYKVGIASGRVLVKRVGTPRNPAEQEPVWAGNPVNFAAKCSQQASRHELIVTASVWDEIENNDFLTVSCPCAAGPRASLWSDVTVEKIPADVSEREGRLLKSSWCAIHGSEYVTAILGGETTRDDAEEARSTLQKMLFANALRRTNQQRRRAVATRRRGLSK